MLLIFLYSSLVVGCSAVKIPEKAPEPLKWWQEGLIYQVYPRSYMDSNGDGIGDLAGIESKLDHVVDLGVTAVWISPIYKSPMKDFGYDISNFTDIEPIFGNMRTFTSLSKAMKARNIKLIMDFVPNHTSDEHPWFLQSLARVDPYTDYYVWKDPIGYDADGKPIPPNKWISVFGGSIWEWRNERQQFYLHQFLVEQPDLNYENPRVMTEMLAVIKFWMDQGVDGLRMDAVSHMFEDPELRDDPPDPDRPEGTLPHEWFYYSHLHTYNLPEGLDALYEFRRFMDVYTVLDGKERCMMVEVASLELEKRFKYYGTQEKPIAHFPFNFDFINHIKQDFVANDIISLVDEWFEKLPEGCTANWLLGNHDNHRVASRYSDSVVDPFNMILHLLPGSSVTYYGEEIGMQDTPIDFEGTVDPYGCSAGPDRFDIFTRDPERTPMQWDSSKNAGFTTGDETWLPVNENYTWLNVKVQRGLPGSHLEIYKKISQIRKTDSWKFGSLQTIKHNPLNVFGYSRIYKAHGFLVLANFGTKEITLDCQAQFDEIPTIGKVFTRSSGFLPENTLDGTVVDTKAVTIGPKHSLIIEI